jgi:hypothetical protein
MYLYSKRMTTGASALGGIAALIASVLWLRPVPLAMASYFPYVGPGWSQVGSECM